MASSPGWTTRWIGRRPAGASPGASRHVRLHRLSHRFHGPPPCTPLTLCRCIPHCRAPILRPCRGADRPTHTQWKSFASFAQVNAFLTALELTAIVSREGSYSADWNTLADQDPDAPVTIVSQPRPVYPARLASRGRVGRVWMTYVISADGRVEQGSFLPLLSDDSLFTRAAIEALLRGRLRPAVSNGQPVPQRVFQVITFRTR
jgi:TonB family protein